MSQQAYRGRRNEDQASDGAINNGTVGCQTKAGKAFYLQKARQVLIREGMLGRWNREQGEKPAGNLDACVVLRGLEPWDGALTGGRMPRCLPGLSVARHPMCHGREWMGAEQLRARARATAMEPIHASLPCRPFHMIDCRTAP